MRLSRILYPAAILFLLLPVGRPAGATETVIRIEPCKTRVGIARVHLELSDLRLAGGRLLGDYRIKIPLAPVLNDRGTIEIGLDRPLAQVIANRGTVLGWSHSVLDGRTHPVVCEFGSSHNVKITIDTGNRILSFNTRFE